MKGGWKKEEKVHTSEGNRGTYMLLIFPSSEVVKFNPYFIDLLSPWNSNRLNANFEADFFFFSYFQLFVRSAFYLFLHVSLHLWPYLPLIP